jgi:hypothetical protein
MGEGVLRILPIKVEKHCKDEDTVDNLAVPGGQLEWLVDLPRWWDQRNPWLQLGPIPDLWSDDEAIPKPEKQLLGAWLAERSQSGTDNLLFTNRSKGFDFLMDSENPRFTDTRKKREIEYFRYWLKIAKDQRESGIAYKPLDIPDLFFEVLGGEVQPDIIVGLFRPSGMKGLGFLLEMESRDQRKCALLMGFSFKAERR